MKSTAMKLREVKGIDVSCFDFLSYFCKLKQEMDLKHEIIIFSSRSQNNIVIILYGWDVWDEHPLMHKYWGLEHATVFQADTSSRARGVNSLILNNHISATFEENSGAAIQLGWTTWWCHHNHQWLDLPFLSGVAKSQWLNQEQIGLNHWWGHAQQKFIIATWLLKERTR